MRLEQHWLHRLLTAGTSPHTVLEVFDVVRLGGPAGLRDIPYADVRRAEVTRGLVWATLTLSTPAGEVVVRGLSPDQAQSALAVIQREQAAHKALQREKMEREAQERAALQRQRAADEARMREQEAQERAAIQRQQALERALLLNQQIRAGMPDICRLHAEWSRLEAQTSYVTDHQFQSWRSDAAALNLPSEKMLPDQELAPENQPYAEAIRRIQKLLRCGRKAVDKLNQAVVAKQLELHCAFFDHVEKYPLTDQQRLAVVHDEDNALVVAGAGCGKTSTIVAKVGYLLKSKLATPDEILLLAYTNKAAEEMRERIQGRFGEALTVWTFHKLGLEIVAEVRGEKPSVAREAEDHWQMQRILSTVLVALYPSSEFRQQMVTFLLEHRVPYKSLFECETMGEYHQYIRTIELRSLAGERVRSLEECEIANWLFLNGVQYEYEAPYRLNTATKSHRQYKPDFYLPDYDIYIEHYALDESWNTPRFIDRQKYVDGVDWKRQVHRQNGTVLVETFSHEKRSGRLLSSLKAKLQAHGVAFRPICA